jgi:hypothetical protein
VADGTREVFLDPIHSWALFRVICNENLVADSDPIALNVIDTVGDLVN